MTHYPVFVIVPLNTRDDQIEAEVERLMAPYNEHDQVPEYETACHCVGDAARDETRAAALAAVGEFVSPVSTSYFDQTDEERNQHDRAFQAWQHRYEMLERAAFIKHPGATLPDPQCGFYTGERQDWWEKDAKPGDRYQDGSGCGGTGKDRTTYNPLSKWDYFGPYQADWLMEMGVPVSQDGVFAVRDLIPVIERDAWRPIAIVIPDGDFPASRWQARERVGWFGTATNQRDPDEWRRHVLDVLQRYSQCKAVICDCHI